MPGPRPCAPRRAPGSRAGPGTPPFSGRCAVRRDSARPPPPPRRCPGRCHAPARPRVAILRDDTTVRRHEGLPLEVVPGRGTVPDTVAVEEAGVRYLAAPHTGQKTGAFLDQRENRVLVGEHTGAGRALDLFTYHGSFALHLARHAGEVVAVDSSADALARGRENAALNELTNITWREANAFDLLRELERREELFDTIVLDPPAFAKAQQRPRPTLAAYKELTFALDRH